MSNNVYSSDLPMGLAGALAKNIDALEMFSSFSKKQKQKVIDHTHCIQSKKEMQAFVNDIAQGKFEC